MGNKKPEIEATETKGMVYKIAIPIIIGFIVIFFLFRKDFNTETFRQIHFTWLAIPGFLFILCAIFLREFGMAWRFNILTSGALNFKKSFITTFLCEFTSCITPTSVGGSALSMIFMNREGVNMGKATTYTLTILFLDNLFYTLLVPLIMIFTDAASIFDLAGGGLEKGLRSVFWVAYGAMAFITVILGLGIFFIPLVLRKSLMKLFSIKILSRFLPKIEETTRNMIVASHEVKNMPWLWWSKAFGATVISWVGRFLVVNAIFFAILPSSPQFEIFCRQIVVWTLLMFTPTPGGSGISEWLFNKYYFDLIPGHGVVMVIALLWRIFTYYIYLIIGVCLIPRFFKKKKYDQLSER